MPKTTHSLHSGCRRWPKAHQAAPAIVPSLLAADPLALGEAISRVQAADALHIDVMDAHFVPNLAFTPAQTQAIAQASPLPLDVHLMMQKPLEWIEAFACAGAFGITLHAEAVDDLPAAIDALRARGVAPGVSVRAETNIEATLGRLEDRAQDLSLLLVMSVAPGFGGQAFDARALDNLRQARHLKNSLGLSYRIEVDGGIKEQNAKEALDAGAESLVIGSALFRELDLAAAIERWRRIVA